MMDGFHNRIYNFKTRYEKQGKQASILLDMPLEMIHPDITAAFGWKDYSDMPEPKRCLYIHHNILQPLNYNSSLLSLKRSIHRSNSHSKVSLPQGFFTWPQCRPRLHITSSTAADPLILHLSKHVPILLPQERLNLAPERWS